MVGAVNMAATAGSLLLLGSNLILLFKHVIRIWKKNSFMDFEFRYGSSLDKSGYLLLLRGQWLSSLVRLSSVHPFIRYIV